MEGLIIRKASHNDIPTLLEFEQGVVTAERPYDPTLRDPVTYYDLPGLINSKDAHLVVAELDGNIIASGYARKDKAAPREKFEHFSYLGFMYVLPAHRGKGIINKILDELKKWSLEKGLTELRLEVYYDNIPAIKSYLKAGFANYLITMRMEL